MQADNLRDCSVVIIGAGIIGSSLTYRLAQAGASVVIVERQYAGSGATGKSFAWLNGYNKHPRNYHRLNVMSIRDWHDLADEVNGQWLSLTGSLHWAPDGASAASRLRSNMRQLRDWGMQVDEMTPDRVTRDLEPDLQIDPHAVSSVFFVGRDGWMDAMSSVQDLLSAATRRYGARVVRATVTGFHSQDGSLKRASLDNGDEISADVVINCAGPHAARIGDLAGAEVPVDERPGVLVTTEPVPGQLRRVVRTPTIHMRPDGGSRLLLHREAADSASLHGKTIQLRSQTVDDTLVAGRELMPALSFVNAESVRAGIRAIPRDGHPLIGFHPSVPNFYIAVTHSGITLGARLALLITQELNGNLVQELDAYRPDRFGRHISHGL